MEYLFEFILELVFEGGIEASKSCKVPKWIRYLLITVISLFFVAVIGIIFLTGILSLKENEVVGIFFLLLGLVMLIMGIIKFKKVYLDKVNKE